MASSDNQNAKQGLGWKGVSAVAFIVLLGGLILAGWVVTKFDLLPTASSENISAQTPADNRQGPDTKTDAVVAKVQELEKRIESIGNIETSSAGYPAPQNDVATALRARRAIESGASLGYIENQLGQRFGDRFPQAVDAIGNLAQSPVTLSELRDDIARNGSRMIGRGSDASIWERFNLELDELFMLRKRGDASTSPAHILQLAEENIGKGDLAEAIKKIQELPENNATKSWLEVAQRYQNANNALDILERAALAAPTATPLLVVPPKNTIQLPDRIPQ